jgi:hypothetical protein
LRTTSGIRSVARLLHNAASEFNRTFVLEITMTVVRPARACARASRAAASGSVLTADGPPENRRESLTARRESREALGERLGVALASPRPRLHGNTVLPILPVYFVPMFPVAQHGSRRGTATTKKDTGDDSHAAWWTGICPGNQESAVINEVRHRPRRAGLDGPARVWPIARSRCSPALECSGSHSTATPSRGAPSRGGRRTPE